MNIISKNKAYLFVLFGIFWFMTVLKAQDIRPPFDANEVIKKVSHCRNLTESREDEFLIDTNLVYIPEPHYQGCPSIAFDGTNYLIVWHDGRDDYADIYGARVDPSGHLLDPAGFAISAAENQQRFPSVAFDGTNFLVVWEDERSVVNFPDIYGARVTQSGIVLDPSGIAISIVLGAQQYEPAVAFDGTDYLVVWEDWRNIGSNAADIYGARVTQSGVVIDPAGIAISTIPLIQRNPAVAFDGTNYLVVWEDFRDGAENIYGARVNQSGIVLDPGGIAISTANEVQVDPSVAFDSTNYLVVWHDRRNGSSNIDIYGARVNQSGVVLDPGGIAISTANHNQIYPSVAFDGINYVVVWDDERSNGFSNDIYGARVTQSGIVLDTAGIAISLAANDEWESSVAFDGTNYIVVWSDTRGPSSDVYGSRVTQSGTVLDPDGIAMTTSANNQESPSVAFGGTNYLVVWEDWCSGITREIYGGRVDPSGNLLDTITIAISNAGEHEWHGHPSVAFDGANYLVVWSEWHETGLDDIYGARVTQSGVVLDTTSLIIFAAANHQVRPVVAFDGVNYLVVWEDLRSDSDIYATRVNQSGIVLDTAGIAISTIPDVQEEPSVAFDGTNYLVVWQEMHNPPFYSDICGARVNQSGVVLDPGGIAISTAQGGQYHPSIAFDGTNYLVVWNDYRNSGSNADIYAARVTQSGVVLDPSGIVISYTADHQRYPSVASDGMNYLVAWMEYRGDMSTDIFGAKVDTSVAIIDSFVISSQQGDQFAPAIAHGQGEQLLITYSGWTDSINAHPANTLRIWGKFYPLVGIEEEQKFTINIVKFGLQVYPNPVNKLCNIKYNLTNDANVQLSVYDVTGRLIKEIVNESQKGGVYNKIINMTNFTQGVYFITLNTGIHSETKKIIFIR